MDRARHDARVLIDGNKKAAVKIEIRPCVMAMCIDETNAFKTALPLVLKFYPAPTCE
jgi:hypothetical protein